MATVHCKMYYVGQGMMNCVWVEDQGEFPYAAIIDCGTESAEGDPFIADSFQALYDIVVDTQYIDIMITHTDDDHFNILSDFISASGIEARINLIFIGSLIADNIENVNGSVVLFPTKQTRIDLWMKQEFYKELSEKYGLQISVLAVNMGTTVNARSAIYGFRTDDMVFLFTGDSTGSTFKALSKIIDPGFNYFFDFVYSLDNRRSVFMTIPHHGSLKTLLEFKFVSVDTNTSIVNMGNLRTFLINYGLSGGHYFSSSGLRNKYFHPSYVVMSFFRDNAAQSSNETSYDAYYDMKHRYSASSAEWSDSWRAIAANRKAIYGSIIWLDDESFAPFSYSPTDNLAVIGAHEIVSNTDSNDDSYSITAYDHKLRPYFTDKFQKTTNDLGESETVSTREYHQTFGGERID